MRNSFSRFTMIAIAALLIILEGCANTPSRFYILNSLDPLENEKPNKATSQEIAIEVGPVGLPQYLDRLPILTRTSQNEFQLSEFDLWAEPLEDNFPRVLAENISILIPTDRVSVFPWNKKKAVDFQVLVEVTRFDCRVDGDCILNARWSLLGKNGKKKLLMKKSGFTEHSLEPDNTARVEALNKTLTDLSREIASAIKALQ